MKLFILPMLLLFQSVTWANESDLDEWGRALGNYNLCSNIATKIDDQTMFKFYQKMLNDTQLPLLALDSERVGIVYAAWSESEAILSAIDEESLKQICLSRIDDLSRRMINNIATQEK